MSIDDLLETNKQLEQALSIIANAGGDYTQNIVSDALYEVGYYFDEEEEEEEDV